MEQVFNNIVNSFALGTRERSQAYVIDVYEPQPFVSATNEATQLFKYKGQYVACLRPCGPCLTFDVGRIAATCPERPLRLGVEMSSAAEYVLQVPAFRCVLTDFLHANLPCRLGQFNKELAKYTTFCVQDRIVRQSIYALFLRHS